MSGLVTVFGGTGFLGTYVVRALARAGWRIRVAARRPKAGYRLPSFGDVGQIQLFGADVTKPQSVEAALEGATACVNLVGILAPGASGGFRKVHADAAKTIAQAAARRGITQFVQVSAIGADPGAPALYARTKAEAEAAVKAAIPTAVIVRPSIVFGPEDGFFNRFAAMAVWSPALPLIGGGKTKFQPVYVGDVALAVANALSDGTAAGRTFELGGPGVYSFKDLMKLTLRETGREHRLLLPLPTPIAALMGLGADMAGALVSGLFRLFGSRAALSAPTPMITVDQVRLLGRDNVVSPGAPGLKDLGVTPTGVESIVPTYLWRYREGGQFADASAA